MGLFDFTLVMIASQLAYWRASKGFLMLLVGVGARGLAPVGTGGCRSVLVDVGGCWWAWVGVGVT